MDNNWVQYFDRSYEQIKASVLARLGVSNPEIKDHSEGNILVVLISIFAGIAEMLGLYIDRAALETFLPTATRYSSMVNIVSLIDYHIHAYNAASTDITLLFVDSNGDPQATTANFSIPAEKEFVTADGYSFISTQTVGIPIGSTSAIVPVKNWAKVAGASIGTSDGSDNQLFQIAANYVEGSMTLYVNGILWELKETLGFSTPTDNHYMVIIDQDQKIQVKFGNGVYGAVPGAGLAITGNYYITDGASANLIQPNTITTATGGITAPGVNTVVITNLLSPSGGSDIESIEEIRVNAPLSIRTLNRAVTLQDFRDLTKLVSGVAAAEAKSCCEDNCVTLYIIPSGGGLASTSLKTKVKEEIQCKMLLGKCLKVESAGETQVLPTFNVVKTYGFSDAQVEQAIKDILDESYAPEDVRINQRVRTSRLISLLYNLAEVNSVDLESLYTKPYARPYNHNVELNWTATTTDNSTEKVNWEAVYMGANVFRISVDGKVYPNIQIGTPFTDDNNTLELTFYAGAYSYGDTWKFPVYPSNTNVDLDDYTLPLVDGDNLVINIVSSEEFDQCVSKC